MYNARPCFLTFSIMNGILDPQNSTDFQSPTEQFPPPSAEMQQDITSHIQTDVVTNKPSVAVVVPESLSKRFGDIAQHVRGRLEESLLRQAIGDWKALQGKMIRSFAAKKSSPSTVFDTETFLSDALRIIEEALESHGVANVTATDATSAQVTLSLNPRAAADLSTPRMLMKLLQIIQRVHQLTYEAEGQRATYNARLVTFQSERDDLQARYDRTPDGGHVNGPIRRDLELQISRLDTQIVDVKNSLARLDRRDMDDILAIGRILNVPYLPQRLPEVANAFIESVRSVPTVASRVSPKELDKLTGNPTLTFSVDLPKRAAEPSLQPIREVRLPPGARDRKPTPRSTPAARPSLTPELRPKEVLYINVPGLGRVRARMYTGSPDALQALADGLKPGQMAVAIGRQMSSSESLRNTALRLAKQYIHDNPGVYAQVYELQSGIPIRDGCVCTVEDYGDIIFAKFDGVPVGAFDLSGHPLSENDLRLYLAALKQQNPSTSPSSAT